MPPWLGKKVLELRARSVPPVAISYQSIRWPIPVGKAVKGGSTSPSQISTSPPEIGATTILQGQAGAVTLAWLLQEVAISKICMFKVLSLGILVAAYLPFPNGKSVPAFILGVPWAEKSEV